jgi:immediate early response 3-interacting protein 1
LQAGLLMTNAVLILNRRRFLSKYGLDNLNELQQGDAHPLRIQAVGLLHAVQYLKVPVIAANLITIVFELILGGA